MTRTATTRRSVAPATSAETASYAPQGDFDAYDEPQDDFVLPADSMNMAAENLEERVQTTQHRLAQLRMEAEALEREKLQFEELSRKQRGFMDGRTEMAEKLGRAVAMLDRETYEAQKRVEQLLVIKDGFHQHLDVVESLNPEEWNPKDLQHDLTRALGIIEDARGEYTKAMSRVQSLLGTPAPAQNTAAPAITPVIMQSPAPAGINIEISRDSFRRWAFCGAAFTAPLLVLAVIYGLIRLITG